MKTPYSSISPSTSRTSKAWREHRAYDRHWLPPFSLPTLIGVALFITFIGSSIASLFHNAADMYQMNKIQSEEEAECASSSLPFSGTTSLLPCLNNSNNAKATTTTTIATTKILYMQPNGGLGSRLRGIASALALGREVNAHVVIVWQRKEYGFYADWRDLFQQPKLTIGCWPSGKSRRPEKAACQVHSITSRRQWLQLQHDNVGWERDAHNNGTEILCFTTNMYLTEKQNDLEWFYQQLVPAPGVLLSTDHFMMTSSWTNRSAWVGVHIRRTDLKLRCTSATCAEGVPVDKALPLEMYINVMKKIQRLNPDVRFYIATDDSRVEREIMMKMNGMASPTRGGSSGEVYSVLPTTLIGDDAQPLQLSSSHDDVFPWRNADNAVSIVFSLPKHVRDSSHSSIAMRSVVSGVQEAVADLWLLSKCQIIVGTVGSTFSQTARLMSRERTFFVTVGAELELKQQE